MAYVSKQDKARLAPGIKAVLNKYNMKGSISVRDHSTLVVKVKSGRIDFSDYFGQYQCLDVNVYWIDSRYAGIQRDFLNELLEACKGDRYFNEDDSMTDYFHRSHYIDIMIGSAWNKPYTFMGAPVTA
tara:strand:- start:310 stop:693 length:384 start_codon:yes stop_codon:yes gene_type:complete